jgi:hypothetical protein
VKKDNSALVDAVPLGGSRERRSSARALLCNDFMASFLNVRLLGVVCVLATVLPWRAAAQGNYAVEGQEYNVSGVLPGEQMFPHASIRTSGGYIVWQDNITDGSGLGISARKLDSSLSSAFSTFRVNENGNADQERPSVSMLNDGGAVFVWEGGKQSFQHIYARFLSAAGTWVTGDVMANTPTNVFQLESAVTTLINGNVVVAWSSFNQVSSNALRDVYFQIMTPAGAKVGIETRANEATAFNQRSAAVAPLSDGRYVVVWVSEQQRFENSVDVYGRIYSATGIPAGSEFLINSGTNVCANPSVARSSDGGFAVAWMQKDVQTRTNSWDIFVRPFSGNALGGVTRRVNTWIDGDQLVPRISAMGTDYLVVWTSMGQDGSRNGVYGQFLRGDGTLYGAEFPVNTTTVSQQIQPAVVSDGVERFLTVWSSFAGGVGSFDLYGQRYVNTNAPLPAPGAPIVTVLSSNSLAVSWPTVQGFSIANYEVFADGAVTATAAVTNTYWTATGLAPASTHSYRLAYVVGDGRRSPLSGSTANTTYSGSATWGGIPQEWMSGYFGGDFFLWPSPYLDSDGDGASNKDEFLAGTDPTNATSVLRQRLHPTAQGLFLEWNTQLGLVYQVWRGTGAGGPWAKVGGPRFAAGAVDSMYVGGGNAGFYRIERLR